MHTYSSHCLCSPGQLGAHYAFYTECAPTAPTASSAEWCWVCRQMPADPGNPGRCSAGRQPHLESRARVTCSQQAWGTCTMVSVSDRAPTCGSSPSCRNSQITADTLLRQPMEPHSPLTLYTLSCPWGWKGFTTELSPQGRSTVACGPHPTTSLLPLP